MIDNLLGKRLKELRIVNNYSQDYVAEVIGKTRQTYSHYETGRRKPSTETLYILSGLYNISMDDLLHLSIDIDRNVLYEAPDTSKSSEVLSDYLDFFNDERNQRKYQYNTNMEKELLYFFQKISDQDKREIIAFTKIKAENQK